MTKARTIRIGPCDYDRVDHFVCEVRPTLVHQGRDHAVLAIGADGERLWIESRHWTAEAAGKAARRYTRERLQRGKR